MAVIKVQSGSTCATITTINDTSTGNTNLRFKLQQLQPYANTTFQCERIADIT